MSEASDILNDGVAMRAEQFPASMVWEGTTYHGAGLPTEQGRENEDAGTSLPWDSSIEFDSRLFTSTPDVKAKQHTATLDDGEEYLMSGLNIPVWGGPIIIRFKRKQ